MNFRHFLLNCHPFWRSGDFLDSIGPSRSLCNPVYYIVGFKIYLKKTISEVQSCFGEKKSHVDLTTNETNENLYKNSDILGSALLTPCYQIILFWLSQNLNLIENKTAICWLGLRALKTLYFYIYKNKLKGFLQEIMKKIILGTSDAWSMRQSSHRPSVLYWRLSDVNF